MAKLRREIGKTNTLIVNLFVSGIILFSLLHCKRVLDKIKACLFGWLIRYLFVRSLSGYLMREHNLNRFWVWGG